MHFRAAKIIKTTPAGRLRYQGAVRDAMPLLIGAAFGQDTEAQASGAARVVVRHLGGGRKHARRLEQRLRFYLDPDNARTLLDCSGQEPIDVRAASMILGRRSTDRPCGYAMSMETAGAKA